MNKTIIFGFAGALLVSGACWAAASISVDQKGLAFSVRKLTIKKGQVVSFLNSDKTSHNILVTGNGIKLNSGLQRPNVAFNAPFAKAGTYQVMCGIHPKMKMSIVVQ